MKEKEKQLFKTLCRFKGEFADESLFEFATPAVLGQLFFNRMQGIAYGTLKNNGILGKVNREFRNSLCSSYEWNIVRNKSFEKCVHMLCEILTPYNCKVAMLKGARLYAIYPDGYRTSNDIDLLVMPKDVSAIGKLLSCAGFRQGYIKSGEFIAATRREIIESKMMRGETVPYIKEVNLPFMKFLEVDINFSLDYKNGNEDILSDMLSHVCVKNKKGFSVPTLDDADFFIHLCAHLYKEATTLAWIEMRRDMTMYKYCDIYMLLSDMTEAQVQSIFSRAAKLGMEKICAYAILETIELFDMENSAAYDISCAMLRDDPYFRLRITSPKDKKTFVYRTADVTERFFADLRVNDLMEVDENENT